MRRAQDRRLSAHVMAVHRDGVAPLQEGGPEPLGADVLRAYIARAKQHDPYFPEELTGARPAPGWPSSGPSLRCERGRSSCRRAVACPWLACITALDAGCLGCVRLRAGALAPAGAGLQRFGMAGGARSQLYCAPAGGPAE
jgi:hypothetical protein